MKTAVVTKTVVLDPDNNVLILRRSASDEARPGALDLLGGGVEQGEDIIQAGVREVLEEGGIQLDRHRLRLFYTATHVAKDVTIIRCCLLARLSEVPIVTLSHEHDDSRWMEIGAAAAAMNHFVWSEALRHLLKPGVLEGL